MHERPTSVGVSRIGDERRRQIEAEGWTKAHDYTEHAGGELGWAAQCYLIEALEPGESTAFWPEGWEWKPSPDPIRNLEKAGALIAAEIDRLLLANGFTEAYGPASTQKEGDG